MKKIAHDPNIDAQLRLDAAKAVAPYLIARIGARPPPADTTNSIGLMGPVQILSIPSRCFLSEEQIKNPDLLLKHAVPILFDHDDDADAVIDGEPDDVVA